MTLGLSEGATPLEIGEAAPLRWRVLNDATQVASKGGRIVAIAYSVPAHSEDGRVWLEFGWLPVDAPDLVDVHFGVEPGGAEKAWERARHCTEWEYARRQGRPAGDP
jgi:hypothetical protein